MGKVTSPSNLLPWTLAVAGIIIVTARNPIVPNVGMADPHAHVFADESRVYLYATHDNSPNQSGFGMRNWWQWSSPDLVTWSLDSYGAFVEACLINS